MSTEQPTQTDYIIDDCLQALRGNSLFSGHISCRPDSDLKRARSSIKRALQRIADPLHKRIAELEHLLEMTRIELEADVGRLREAWETMTSTVDFDGDRQGLHDLRDPEIRALCERIGYGAVMDSAARQWREKCGIGAFIIGPCVGTALAAREALAGTKEKS